MTIRGEFSGGRRWVPSRDRIAERLDRFRSDARNFMENDSATRMPRMPAAGDLNVMGADRAGTLTAPLAPSRYNPDEVRQIMASGPSGPTWAEDAATPGVRQFRFANGGEALVQYPERAAAAPAAMRMAPPAAAAPAGMGAGAGVELMGPPKGLADANDNGIPDFMEVKETTTRGPDGEKTVTQRSWREPREQQGPPATMRTALTNERQARGASGLQKWEEDMVVSRGMRSGDTGARERALAIMAARDVAPRREHALNMAEASGQAEARKFEAQRDVAETYAGARRYGADATVTREGVRQEGANAREDEKTRRAREQSEFRREREVEVETLRGQNRLAEASQKALSFKTVAEINAESDQAVAQLNKEGRVEAAKVLGKYRGKVDPVTAMQAMAKATNAAEAERILRAMAGERDEGNPAPAPAAGKAPAAGAAGKITPEAAKAELERRRQQRGG